MMMGHAGLLAASGFPPYVGTKAAQLDGVDEYLTATVATTQNSGFAASCWVKRNDASGSEAVCQKRDNASNLWQLTISATGVVTATWTLSANISAATSAGTYTTGTWAHIVMCCDTDSGSQRVRIWVNGTLAATATGTLTLGSNNGILWLGRLSSGSYLNGLLCDWFLWNVSLTNADVTAMYNGGTRGDPEALSGLTAIAAFPWQSTDSMTGTTGFVDNLKSAANATPFNTESGDLVDGPP